MKDIREKLGFLSSPLPRSELFMAFSYKTGDIHFTCLKLKFPSLNNHSKVFKLQEAGHDTQFCISKSLRFLEKWNFMENHLSAHNNKLSKKTLYS